MTLDLFSDLVRGNIERDRSRIRSRPTTGAKEAGAPPP
jgi:hypothetical protein